MTDKTIERSYRACRCDNPVALPLPCHCLMCVTCKGYLEWAHDDSSLAEADMIQASIDAAYQKGWEDGYDEGYYQASIYESDD